MQPIPLPLQCMTSSKPDLDMAKSIRYRSVTIPADRTVTSATACQHQHLLQLQQQHQYQTQQRCSSVGSTGSSTCETLSSLSGSALSPNATTTATTTNGMMTNGNLSGSAKTHDSSPRASSCSLTQMPGDRGRSRYSAAELIDGERPADGEMVASTATAIGEPPGALTLGSLNAAAMAANLAESFTLLHQQAYHFRDILCAAHFLGRGYYQPAGPLISSHILAQPPNVPPLLPPSVGAPSKSKHQQQIIPVPLGSDPAELQHPHLQPHHLQQSRPPTAAAAADTDGHVLITGSDLTPYRYQTQGPGNNGGNVPPPHQSPHHHQQPPQQSHHQLHHQGGSPYPRSMHYSTAYPPNYYIPYPGEPMCYSTPSAYQPYFSTKVYQNTGSHPPHPPPPHHPAYRRYAYQTGPSPSAPVDHPYEHPQQPPTSAPTTGTSSTSPASPPSSGGSQLVAAAGHHHAHAQHLEHYSSPSYYPNYNPGGGSPAGQCYTRSIQSPYMDYPQCPCPMQQSCPKNVHTGPHIGNNNSNNNSNNNVLLNNNNSCNSGAPTSTAATNSSNSDNTVHNSYGMPPTTAKQHLTVDDVHTNCSTNNGSGSDTSKINHNNSYNVYNLNATNHNDSLNTNRGPVTNNNNNINNNNQKLVHAVDKECNSAHDLLQEVKSEMKLEEVSETASSGKSQYEENVQPPPTPPESYGTLEDDEKEDRYGSAATQMRSDQQHKTVGTPVAIDRSMGPPPRMESYDLTSGGAQDVASTNKVVGRKARIGKTMAREMVYAGTAHGAAATSGPLPMPQFRKVCVAPDHQSAAAEPQTGASHKMGPAIVKANPPPTDDTSAELLLLKSKIKMEKIKLEDEFPMTTEKPQGPMTDHTSVKAVIKTEPNDTITKENSENNNEEQSEDGVLDLCQSPLPGDVNGGGSTKRMKILEQSKSCKKSPTNGYKSLIKQAEPRTYLCLSRKIDKRGNRYRKLCKTHWRFNTGGNLRGRQLTLTDQQKKRLRLRKKKLQDMEKRRQEIHEKRRAEGRQKFLKMRALSKAEGDKASKAILPKTVEDQSKEATATTTASSSEESVAPPRRPTAVVVPMSVLQSTDEVLGYYSDPETRSPGGGVTSLFRSCEPKNASKRPPQNLVGGSAANDEKSHRNFAFNAGASSGYEKRSKSETKKPIKPSSEIRLLAVVPKVPKTSGVKKDLSEERQTEAVDGEHAQKTKTSQEDAGGGSSKHVSAKKTKLSVEKKPSTPSMETNNNEYDNTSNAAGDAKAAEMMPSCPTGASSTESTPPTAVAPGEVERFQTQHSDHAVFLAPPQLPRIACHAHHHYQTSGKRSRSRSKFGGRKKQKFKHSAVSFELDDTLPPAIRGDVIPKWNNGWMWEGEPFQGAVFLNSDDPRVIRTCYPAMRHSEGDIIRARDCVLLKANEDNELPYVAKVAHLWENPEDGEMMMSLLWYYRPEHTEQGRQQNECPDEVYASRHRDHNSVACIEDKCYVLTFSEYCRYRRRLRAVEEDMEDVNIVPKKTSCYSNLRPTPPDNTNPELVMFCRRAYEFRTKRLLKMPNKQDYYVVTS